MTTILVSILLRSYLEWMSILRLMLQRPIADHLNSRYKALDREVGYQLLALQGNLDAIVNLVSQLAANQKPHYVVRVFGIRSSNDHHTSVCPSSQQSGVDEHPQTYAANTIADHHSSRDKGLDKEDGSQLLALEGKLDALVNLVTQLAANQMPASVARVFGIRSSNDHHTSVCPSSQQSGVDRSAETRKLEGKLDALVNLVTQLAVNQKLASVARVFHIRSSNDHHTSVCPSSQQFGVDEHPEPYAANTHSRQPQQGVHDVATYTSADTRKLEGKLDALVNLVTQIAANQKPASVARVFGIRSSTDHHTSVCPSSQQSVVDEHPEAYGVHDVATDTSAESTKVEGKIDALVNLVTQLAANQKLASVARVYGIRSFNDHHTSVCPSLQQSGVDEHPEAYAANTYSRPPQ
ncbi:hypothetical protein Fmac_028580 [Flemingia macrophylla]|uniref:Uncharacterized protein n=1 Tax=Flemingia macrophylla TaxID=520843 RepID=A0ABD1L7Z2_9FABA